jgi:hypothetical protein
LCSPGRWIFSRCPMVAVSVKRYCGKAPRRCT